MVPLVCGLTVSLGALDSACLEGDSADTLGISATPSLERSSLSVARNGSQKAAENGRAELAKSAMEYMRHSRMADSTVRRRVLCAASVARCEGCVNWVERQPPVSLPRVRMVG
jgi:hypothetical protein